MRSQARPQRRRLRFVQHQDPEGSRRRPQASRACTSATRPTAPACITWCSKSLDNAIDEALAGYCDDIKVVIHADNSISVVDNGRGIPTDIKDDDERSARAAEIVMTELHAGGKFDQNSYKVSGGLHGVGVSVVNALSDWLKLDDLARRQDPPDGIPPRRAGGAARSRRHDRSARHRSALHGRRSAPSTTSSIHYDILAKRIRELSFLNNGTKIELIDQRDGKSENFAYAGGIKGFVEYMNRSKIGAAPEDLPCDRREGRHHRRSRDAVERLVRRNRCSASRTTSRSATAART